MVTLVSDRSSLRKRHLRRVGVMDLTASVLRLVKVNVDLIISVTILRTNLSVYWAETAIKDSLPVPIANPLPDTSGKLYGL